MSCRYYGDFLAYSIDGIECGRISGTGGDWATINIPFFTDGDHEISWTYSKSSSWYSGDDCGWIQNVAYVSGMPSGSPFEYTESSGQLTITGYRGLVPEQLTIPSKIDGKTVVAIGEDAFNRNSNPKWANLVSLVIPDSVKRIGEGAFYQCSLKDVVIGSGVVEIQNRAFDTKDIMTKFVFKGLPPTVIYNSGMCEPNYGFSFEGGYGVYSPTYASQWEAVIDDSGEWKGLTMGSSLYMPSSGFSYLARGNEVTIIGYAGSLPENLVIPETLGGKTVTKI